MAVADAPTAIQQACMRLINTFEPQWDTMAEELRQGVSLLKANLCRTPLLISVPKWNHSAMLLGSFSPSLESLLVLCSCPDCSSLPPSLADGDSSCILPLLDWAEHARTDVFCALDTAAAGDLHVYLQDAAEWMRHGVVVTAAWAAGGGSGGDRARSAPPAAAARAAAPAAPAAGAGARQGAAAAHGSAPLERFLRDSGERLGGALLVGRRLWLLSHWLLRDTWRELAAPDAGGATRVSPPCGACERGRHGSWEQLEVVGYDAESGAYTCRAVDGGGAGTDGGAGAGAAGGGGGDGAASGAGGGVGGSGGGGGGLFSLFLGTCVVWQGAAEPPQGCAITAAAPGVAAVLARSPPGRPASPDTACEAAGAAAAAGRARAQDPAGGWRVTPGWPSEALHAGRGLGGLPAAEVSQGHVTPGQRVGRGEDIEEGLVSPSVAVQQEAPPAAAGRPP